MVLGHVSCRLWFFRLDSALALIVSFSAKGPVGTIPRPTKLRAGIRPLCFLQIILLMTCRLVPSKWSRSVVPSSNSFLIMETILGEPEAMTYVNTLEGFRGNVGSSVATA